jgi:hypothetical protein
MTRAESNEKNLKCIVLVDDEEGDEYGVRQIN